MSIMDNYEPLEVIGSGSFGVIRKVKRRSDGKFDKLKAQLSNTQRLHIKDITIPPILARKEIDYRKMTEKEKRQLVAEVNILRELKHPNIVRYYERVVDKENRLIYILMEYCEGGDLATIIRRCKKEEKRIPEEIVWYETVTIKIERRPTMSTCESRILFTQLLQALHECHNGAAPKKQVHPTILHRDIKPDNVFLDGGHNVKLGDFGLSRVIEDPDTEFAKTYVGTPFYMSPELVKETSYNAKSDIWALGCLIYELCTLDPPFSAKTHAELTNKIQQGKVAPLPPMYSSDLNRVVRAMLRTNQADRPSAGDFLKLDRIKLVISEREFTHAAEMKKREAELAQREMDVAAREVALLEREKEIMRKADDLERGLKGKEEEVRRREVECGRREGECLRKEGELRSREGTIGVGTGMGTGKFGGYRERQPFMERDGIENTNPRPHQPHTLHRRRSMLESPTNLRTYHHNPTSTSTTSTTFSNPFMPIHSNNNLGRPPTVPSLLRAATMPTDLDAVTEGFKRATL
ncbi:hypothetical protein HK097_002415, partial [Rhizophlyctis rosea]